MIPPTIFHHLYLYDSDIFLTIVHDLVHHNMTRGLAYEGFKVDQLSQLLMSISGTVTFSKEINLSSKIMQSIFCLNFKTMLENLKIIYEKGDNHFQER